MTYDLPELVTPYAKTSPFSPFSRDWFDRQKCGRVSFRYKDATRAAARPTDLDQRESGRLEELWLRRLGSKDLGERVRLRRLEERVGARGILWGCDEASVSSGGQQQVGELGHVPKGRS